jgi:hypothetical protein
MLSFYSEDALDPEKQSDMTDSQIEDSVERSYRRRYFTEFIDSDAEEEGLGDGFLQQTTDTDTKPIGSSSDAL